MLWQICIDLNNPVLNAHSISSVLPAVPPPLQMSNLVASQIMAHTDVGSRASSIEKWLAVADICRCLNNYNGVLEITSALNRSAIYRLKKTWAKVCKQVGDIVESCGSQTSLIIVG